MKGAKDFLAFNGRQVYRQGSDSASRSWALLTHSAGRYTSASYLLAISVAQATVVWWRPKLCTLQGDSVEEGSWRTRRYEGRGHKAPPTAPIHRVKKRRDSDQSLAKRRSLAEEEISGMVHPSQQNEAFPPFPGPAPSLGIPRARSSRALNEEPLSPARHHGRRRRGSFRFTSSHLVNVNVFGERRKRYD